MLKSIKDLIPIIEPAKNGYYEIYQDVKGKIIKKIWHQNPQKQLTKEDFINEELEYISQIMKFKSKQQLDEETHFALLLQDDYELIITKVEPDTRDKYQAKPDKDGKIPQEEIVNITLEVIGFKDGKPTTDEEGGDAGGRNVFFTFRPQAMGYSEGGTIPSKSRSFLAFATGQEVDNELELENYEALVGKTIYAEIVQYTNSRGKKRNKISRILPPPRK